MTLSYFNSYFEILVGLNLGYAVFGYYRKELSDRIFRINRLSEWLENLKSRLKIHQAELNDNKEFSKALNHISSDVNIQSKKLKIEEERERYFLEILKPISFVLSLLCISFLIIAAFQDTFCKTFFSEYFFFLSTITAVYTYTIFFCSFSNRIIVNKIKINIPQVILFFFLFVLVSYYCTAKHFFDASINIQLVIIIVFPILCYLLGIGFRILKVKKYAGKSGLTLFLNFTKFIGENFKPIFIFVSTIFISYIPVILYLKNPNYLIIKYLIILITPMFLYLFVAIRVFFHRKKFGKKYKQLSTEQALGLDLILKSIEDRQP